MEVLILVNLASLVLMLISLFFTIIQIIEKIKMRKYKEIFVDKIISFMQKNMKKEQIIAILRAEDYPEEMILSKYDEIKELMNIS